MGSPSGQPADPPPEAGAGQEASPNGQGPSSTPWAPPGAEAPPFGRSGQPATAGAPVPFGRSGRGAASGEHRPEWAQRQTGPGWRGGQPPSPPGSPPSPGFPSRRRTGRRIVLGITAVVVAVAMVVATTLVILGGRDRLTDRSSSGSSGDEVEPAPTTPPTPAELEAAVAEISDFVADERGLEFRQPVDVELEEDDAFEARLLEDFDEEAESMAETQVLYRALGLIGPDEELIDVLAEAYGGGVVGFYDPETDELVVRGAALTPSVRVTIAHELVHALDDQHFDLDRTQYDEADDEIGYGFSALVEGQATVVEEAYLASLGEDEQDQYFDELMAQIGGGMPDVPEVLLQVISSPYVDGPRFVAALQDSGDDAVAAAYDDPPRTSEQVLHPDVYLEGEGGREVQPPPADGEAVEDGVLGELMIALTLGQAIDQGDAEAAAEGWGGDWATAWEQGEQSCMRATMVGDSADDSDELEEAWTEWAGEVDLEVTVDQPAVGDPVTVTACT